MGEITLVEALELTALIALRDRARGSRFSVRWVQRFVDERGTATIEEVALAAAALAALGGPGHADATAFLHAIAERVRVPRPAHPSWSRRRAR